MKLVSLSMFNVFKPDGGIVEGDEGELQNHVMIVSEYV